jgi:hypothetical protein
VDRFRDIPEDGFGQMMQAESGVFDVDVRGLATLSGDGPGGGPSVPMVPGTWKPVWFEAGFEARFEAWLEAWFDNENHIQ